MRGKVKWFSDSCCYGIIEKEDGGEILEHISESASAGRKTFSEIESLIFDSFTDPKGPNAPHIVKLTMPSNDI
jgi:cold shock CspA family protein